MNKYNAPNVPKVRIPKRFPLQITLTFDLIGDQAEQVAQYEWLKMLEKTTLSSYIQALFQCNYPAE